MRMLFLLMWTFVIAAGVLGGRAITAQDAGQEKYKLKVPDGLAFEEFRGYEGWQVVSVSQGNDLLKVIVANPVMIEAYKAGIPGNGQPFPDGARSAKVMWVPQKLESVPFTAHVAGPLKHVDFMVKDSTRFAAIGGWGYAQFNYDPASDRFAPDGTGAACGTACHTIVKANDYVFTKYGRR